MCVTYKCRSVAIGGIFSYVTSLAFRGSFSKSGSSCLGAYSYVRLTKITVLTTLFNHPSTDLDLLLISSRVYTFLPYASQFGFFLHAPRFLQLALTAPTAGVRHIDALISAVRLWGSRISKNPALHAREPELLSQAVKQVSDSLFITGQGNRGHDVLYVIQAEVLLANYFFFLNRFLEGRYHCSAAVSLALSCKLNLIGKRPTGTGAGVGGQLGLGTPVEFPGSSLPEPEDSIQEGERINAFWAVYMLDKVWAVAMESNSSIVDQGPGQTKIDTPWPMPMEAHEAVSVGWLRLVEVRKTEVPDLRVLLVILSVLKIRSNPF